MKYSHHRLARLAYNSADHGIVRPGDGINAFNPHAREIRVLNTSETGMHMQALVNVTNPTLYTASIPYVNAHVFSHGHRIGEVTAENLDVKVGNNTNILVTAIWDPSTFGGDLARAAGQRLLSDYLSGKSANITLRSHEGSIPSMPEIGKALSGINMTTPAPRFRLPGDDDNEGRNNTENQRFIREATFHLFSSTANFVLASPLQHNIIYVERVSAAAFYNHTEPVGHIIHEESFPAPPGLSQTPRLPVDWSPGSVGYDKLKKALGGTLKLDAVANVSIRIGDWREDVTYEGQGIGAKVHL